MKLTNFLITQVGTLNAEPIVVQINQVKNVLMIIGGSIFAVGLLIGILHFLIGSIELQQKGKAVLIGTLGGGLALMLVPQIISMFNFN